MIVVDLSEVAHIEVEMYNKRVVYYLKGNNKAFVLTGGDAESFMSGFNDSDLYRYDVGGRRWWQLAGG